MIIDCERCVIRQSGHGPESPECQDCVVTFLLTPAEFNRAEERAVAALALVGLVPPLRLRVAGD